MSEPEHIELDLKRAMHARWDSKHPSRDMEANVQRTLRARRTQKRIAQFVGAFAFSTAALLVALLIFALPTGQGTLWLNGFFAPNTTLFTLFACPTPIPTRAGHVTASPPTPAPAPTLGSTRTPRPTRVKRTRVPRPTPLPTPTVEYLTGDSSWEKYQDPEYGYSFEYPSRWLMQTIYDTRNMPGIGRRRGNYVNIWNYSRSGTAPTAANALFMRVYLDPALCNASTVEEALAQLEPVEELTTLVSREPVAGYPAWQHTIRPSYPSAPAMIEIVVQRNRWLYRLQAAPANSQELDVFEHLLATFKTP